MGPLLSYSLFSSIILALLYLAYKWVMAGENQHAFNRMALWCIYAVSLLALPLMALHESAVTVELTAMELPDMTGMAEVSATPVGEPVAEVAAPVWPRIVLWIYLAGVVAVIGHTLLVGWRLWRVIHRGEEVDEADGYRIVVTDDAGIAPFSWCRYVVMNRRDYEAHGGMILAHELRHLGLGHWVDLLMAQMVGVLQWYNPAAWLMREELKTVHEYQADKAVLLSGVNARDYQMLLISKALGRRFPSLANCLNHSKLKKRITMMYDERTSALRRLRGLILLPALGVAFFVTDIDAVAAVITGMAEATFGIGEGDGEQEVAGETVAAVDVVHPDAETVMPDAPETETAPVESDADGQETVPTDKARRADDAAESRPAGGDELMGGVKVVAYVGEADAGAEAAALPASRDEAEIGSQPPAEAAGESSVADNGSQPSEVVYSVVEEKPKFPGGDAALLKFVAQHIRYPREAQKNNIDGRVVVQFIVRTDGCIGDVRVIRGVDPALDAEAVRVAKLLPAFTPGKINGQPAAVWYTLPVIFKLKGAEPKKQDVKTVALDVKRLKEEDVELYIDGVRIDDGENALAMLDPRRIARVDVLKAPDQVYVTLKPQADSAKGE